MTRLENELAKMRNNQLEIFSCIKTLCTESGLFTELTETCPENQRKSVIDILNAAAAQSWRESYIIDEIVVYCETWKLLANRMQYCTDLETLKAENRMATARINRLSKAYKSIYQAHQSNADFVSVQGNARGGNYEANRIKFL